MKPISVNSIFTKDVIIIILVIVLIATLIINGYAYKKTMEVNKVGYLSLFLSEDYVNNLEVEELLKAKLKEDYSGDVYTDIQNYVAMNLIEDIKTLENPRDSEYIKYYSKEEFTRLFEFANTQELLSSYKSLNESIFYVNLQFYKKGVTYNEFESNINDINKHDQLIIDLRDSPGGDVSEMEKVLECFVNKGDRLYSIKSNLNTEHIISNTEPKVKVENIIILSNEKTASSSEILMTSIKENLENVTIIGQTSYGKGFVTNIYSFKDGTGVSLINAYWLTPNGININLEGVMPDIVIEDTVDALDEAVKELEQY